MAQNEASESQGSTARHCLPGLAPSPMRDAPTADLLSAVGSQTLAASCAREATAWCPRVPRIWHHKRHDGTSVKQLSGMVAWMLSLSVASTIFSLLFFNHEIETRPSVGEIWFGPKVKLEPSMCVHPNSWDYIGTLVSNTLRTHPDY